MMKRTKAALVVGTAALAIVGIGGGVAFAASGNSTSTTGTPSARPAHQGQHGLMSKVEHGELTVKAAGGNQVLDVQRGTIIAVDPTSITVRSADGYTASYAVNGNAKVRKNKQTSNINAVVVGDRVRVTGVKNDTTDETKNISDQGPTPSTH